MTDLERQTDSEFSWSAHPAAERPGSAVFAALAVVAISVCVWVSFDSLAWGGVSLVALVAALNRFFFPSKFTINLESVTAQYPLARRQAHWKHLRRFAFDDNGGYLSSREKPSRLDGYRGLHLLWGMERDAAVSCIKSNMACHGAMAHADEPTRGEAHTDGHERATA